MFENIVGLDRQKDMLKSMIEKNNISHSYLFTGKSGIGKCLIAKDFAKYIIGTDSLESCPDFKYITKKDDKKDILIEQIRKEIIDDVYIAPISSDKKVYVIDDANYLNLASQNALLKTLEDPPEYVVIILIASSVDAFLTTVKSRLNIINFEGLDDRIIYDYILKNKNISLSDKVLKYLDGSLGQAIYLVDNNYNEKFEVVETLYKKIAAKDYIAVNKCLSDIEFSDSRILEYLEHILYMNGKYSCVKFVEKAKVRLKNNGNYDIVIDNMILRIINNI